MILIILFPFLCLKKTLIKKQNLLSYFTVFYLFMDGEKLVNYLNANLPIKDYHKISLIKRFNDVTYAVLFGVFITALIQGLLAGIGFFIFGFIY